MVKDSSAVLPMQHTYVSISNEILNKYMQFGDLTQAKLTFMVLSQILASQENEHIVYTDIKETIDILGVKKDMHKRRQYLKEQYKKVIAETKIDLSEPDKPDSWNIQQLFYASTGDNVRGYMSHSINPELLKEHFEMFVKNGVVRRYYKKIWVDDIYALPRAARGVTTPYSACLYLALLGKSMNSVKVNRAFFTVKELKKIFGMSDTLYTQLRNDPEHPGKMKVHFDRTIFENKVLNKALREIAETSKAIKLSSREQNGNVFYYEKKTGERSSVMGYVISYEIVPDLDKAIINEEKNSRADEKVLEDPLCKKVKEYSGKDLNGSEIAGIVKKLKNVPEALLDQNYNGSTRSDRMMQMFLANLLSMRSADKQTRIEKKAAYISKMITNEIKEFLVNEEKVTVTAEELRLMVSENRSQIVAGMITRCEKHKRNYLIDFERVKNDICISGESEISQLQKQTWIDPMELYLSSSDIFIVKVKGKPQAADYITKKYSDILQNAIVNMYGLDVTIVFAVESELKKVA